MSREESAMNDDGQSKTALAKRLREIGYEVDDNDGAFRVKLEGSCAFIMVGRDEITIHDISVSYPKAERILAILAEPDRPVVPLTVFAPRLAEALTDVKNLRATDAESEIRITSFTLVLTPRRNGDIRIEFRPEKPDALDERVVVFAKMQGLTVASDYSDFLDLANDIRNITQQIHDVARGIELAK